MKRSIRFTGLALLTGLILNVSMLRAQSLTETAAKQMASSRLGTADVHLVHTEKSGQTPLLYIFNADREKKFAIVSASENVRNIVLAYSMTDSVTWENAPESFVSTVQNFANGILSSMNASKAQCARSMTECKVSTATDAVEPLIKAQWNQGWPYNLMCPTIDGQATMTGCVQTAMAMVMYYHQWPKRYDWDSMLDEYTYQSPEKSNLAVAQLMYDLGVSNNATYGCYETGSTVNTKNFIEKFDYDRDMQEMALKCCSVSYLEELLRAELRANRPVLVSGGSSDGGHEFVCDGFDAEGYFHFNFGWGGNGNGNFLVTATGFDSSPTYLYNIKPNEGGTGKITTMSVDDFLYQNGAFKCDLRYYCLGDTQSEGLIEIALALEDKLTGAVSYHLCGTQFANVEISAPDGDYKVYPVARFNGGEWEKFTFTDLMQSYVDLNVKDGVQTFANNGLVDPLDEGKVKVDGLFYTLDSSDKTASITYKNDRKNSYQGVVSIPATISYNGETYDVTSVGPSAFESSVALDSVHIGKNVQSIDMGAFGQSSLRAISFEDGCALTTVGGWAFNAATQLKRLELPSGVTTLGMCCMQSDFALKYISIPSSVVNFNQYSIWLNEGTEVHVCWDNPSEERADLLQYYDDTIDLKKCTLYVPDGTAEQYSAKIPWSYLNILTEGSASGIEDVLSEGINETKKDIFYYNMSGQRVKSDIPGLKISNGQKYLKR